MKVAIVHYWIVGRRGGEKVLEALCELYPDADIYTLVTDFKNLSPILKKHKISTSFLQKIGGIKHYQRMLPLMPMALESFDLSGYDLVISSESGPAKGIVPPPEALHICYCHSPMRYIWDLYPQYRQSAGWLGRLMLDIFSPWLRTWDVTTATRVDHFIANSTYVAKRINRYYRRPSKIIHPPVDVDSFKISKEVENYYLCAGQVTPYKKVEIAIEAFTRLNKPLVVAGGGVTEKLRRMAGPTITFLGKVNDKELADCFSKARALVYPGLEDFGIVPLESLASGRPVIAYAKGGALETVVEGAGILFPEQTADSLIAAVEEMERTHQDYDPERLRAFAMDFERPKFLERLKAHIDQLIALHNGNAPASGARAQLTALEGRMKSPPSERTISGAH